jgi:hypothetical protein
MRRISKTRTARTKRLKERYADSHGICFDEYRLWLPERVSDWPSVRRVTNPSVCQMFHRLYPTCWNCAGTLDVQAHHGCAGYLRGRSDELTLLWALCGDFGNGCHGKVATPSLSHGRLLMLKWKHDREHLDWVRVALVWRRHLPDLE